MNGGSISSLFSTVGGSRYLCVINIDLVRKMISYFVHFLLTLISFTRDKILLGMISLSISFTLLHNKNELSIFCLIKNEKNSNYLY